MKWSEVIDKITFEMDKHNVDLGIFLDLNKDFDNFEYELMLIS